MKTEFYSELAKYFNHIRKRGLSVNTIATYRECFKHFILFLKEEKNKRKFFLEDLNYENVINFLDVTKDKSSASTANLRLAAISSFCEFLIQNYPDRASEYLRVKSIKRYKTSKKSIVYLSKDGVEKFLSCFEKTTRTGYRDYTIFLLLLTTGLRVSEIINLRVCNIIFSDSCTIEVHGKGDKWRLVPLPLATSKVLKTHMENFKLFYKSKSQQHVFTNHSNCGFTRQGINYLVSKYTGLGHSKSPDVIPSKLSPHKFRYSYAMYLVESGVDLISIRDLLGHSNVATTEVYAKASERLKKEAISKLENVIFSEEEGQEELEWKPEQFESWIFKNFDEA